jgi:hypothetical protein
VDFGAADLVGWVDLGAEVVGLETMEVVVLGEAEVEEEGPEDPS